MVFIEDDLLRLRAHKLMALPDGIIVYVPTLGPLLRIPTRFTLSKDFLLAVLLRPDRIVLEQKFEGIDTSPRKR